MSYSGQQTKTCLGLICLFTIIFITVLSSAIIKEVSDKGYKKAFAFSYYNYSFLVILLGVNFLKKKCIIYFEKRKYLSKANLNINPVLPDEEGLLNNDTAITAMNLENFIDPNEYEKSASELRKESNTENISETFERLEGSTKLKYNENFHFMCIYLMILWYFSNSLYNLGLMNTSISSSNTISNSSIIFILLIKIFMYKSKLTIYKIVAVIIVVLSLTAIFILDQEQEVKAANISIFGDFMIVAGALVYSIFALAFKIYQKKFQFQFDVIEVFGFIGLYNMILIPFCLIVFNITSIEFFEFPDKQQFLYIFLNAMIGSVVSDTLQTYSIVLLSPHIVSFGLALNIPVSYIWDLMFNNTAFDWRFVCASLMILVAFAIILYEKIYKKRK